MKKFTNTVSLHSLFGNIMRKRHVLISLRTPSGAFILSGKSNFYPEGIYRLMGGGVEESETYIEAAVREIREETSLTVYESMLQPLFSVETRGEYEGKTYINVTEVYEFVVESERSLTPGDDITSLVVFDKYDLEKLIAKYYGFSEHDWYIEDDYKHSWKDYGQMYGYIHMLLLKHSA